MSGMPLRVRFVYTGADWSPANAARPWRRRTATVGGSRTAAGGVPASYVVRRDRILGLTLRIEEADEWEEFEAMIEWGQLSEIITVYLDYPDVNVGVDCYLESPKAGMDLLDNRSGEFGPMLEPDIELRRVDGLVWDQQYFIEDPAAS